MNSTSFRFSRKLITWYLENKRDLPWRQTKNPYPVWLSEIILQQTRVDQGLPYFLRFVEAFPTLADLAHATEPEVLKLWQGLGYYSRARNLLKAAKTIYFEKNGIFPASYSELLKLKGVGDYTAAAIASFCYDEAVAVVDGNVYRVLSRVFGIDTPINSSGGKKEFKNLAMQLIDPARPGDFNQALMEFGAMQCVPRHPDCELCIFQKDCVAFNTGRIEMLPVKLKANPVRKRYFNYIILKTPSSAIEMEQRKEGIWQGLFQFPLIESNRFLTVNQLKKSKDFAVIIKDYGVKSITLLSQNAAAHKLSHQHIFSQFWLVEIEHEVSDFLLEEQVKALPVPVLIADFINNYYLK